MSRRLALGTVMSAFVMLGCAAAAPGPGEEQSGEPPLVAEVTKDLSLGTFLFEVDPSLPADQMVKVSDITAATKTITRPGQVAQATVTEVTSTVAVYNATSPVWTTSGAGGYTTLKFGVWNKDSANALDEPYLRIDSITITSGSGTVTFAENSTPANHTFVAGSTSGNYGTYYLADMNAYCTSGTGCTGSARDYAVQQMRINASSSTMAYSFVAKVYATQVSDTTGNPGIYPDLDQDTFNTEPYNQYAGGDCNDTVVSTAAATCGTSGCTGSCGTSSGSCPSPGTSSNCCSQTGVTGATYCGSVSGGCSCTETFGSSGGNGGIDCASGSNCSGTYPAGGTQFDVIFCGSGATCNMNCANATTHSNCGIHCVSGSTCSITCPAGSTGVNAACASGFGEAGDGSACTSFFGPSWWLYYYCN